jgi:hypothetical protein
MRIEIIALLLIILSVIGEPIYEGLFHRGLKSLSKTIQTVWTANWFAMWYYVELNWIIFAIYFVLRLTTFGAFFNYFAGLKQNHLGTTCWWDIYIEKYIRKPGIWYTLIAVLIMLILKHFDYYQYYAHAFKYR